MARSRPVAAATLMVVSMLCAARAAEAADQASLCGDARWNDRWGPSPPSCQQVEDEEATGTEDGTGDDEGPDEAPPAWRIYEPAPGTPGAEQFKLWYVEGREASRAAAPTVLSLLAERHPPIVELFGRNSLPDAGCPCDGGDGRLDVYLLPVAVDPRLGIVFATQVVGFPVEGRCAEPAYLKLGTGDTGCHPEILASILAHELTHTIQYTYGFPRPCLWQADGLLNWWREATAVWAEWVFFDKDPRPASYSADGCGLGSPRGETYLQDHLRDSLAEHTYEGWVFPLYLSLRYGSDLVPKVWERLEAEDGDVARALEAALDETAGQDDLHQVWADFSAANFNVPPVDHYARAGIAAQGRREEVLVGSGDGMTAVPLPSPMVRPLAAHHYEVAVGPDVHLLAFETGLGDEPPEALRVQALPRVAGQERRGPEDWTYRESVTFCRDRRDQRVEDVLLVVSNGDWSTDAPDLGVPAARWVTSDLHCGRWRGGFTLSTDGSGLIPDLAAGTEHHELTVDAEFEPLGAGLDEDGLEVAFFGRGTLHYQWSGSLTIGDRTVTCGGERTAAFADGAVLQLRHRRDGHREYQFAGQTQIDGPIGIGCDGEPVEGAPLLWAYSGDWRRMEAPDRIAGAEESGGDGARVTRTWSLEAEASSSPPDGGDGDGDEGDGDGGSGEDGGDGSGGGEPPDGHGGFPCDDEDDEDDEGEDREDAGEGPGAPPDGEENPCDPEVELPDPPEPPNG